MFVGYCSRFSRFPPLDDLHIGTSHHADGPPDFCPQHIVVGGTLPPPQHSLHGSEGLRKPSELAGSAHNMRPRQGMEKDGSDQSEDQA